MSEEAGRAADAAVTARAAAGLAEALIEMGSHAEAIEQATRARRLADRVGDEDLAARALLALGRSENDAGHLRQGAHPAQRRPAPVRGRRGPARPGLGRAPAVGDMGVGRPGTGGSAT